METWSRLTNLLERLSSYPPLEVFAEIAVIWLVVYAIVRFTQGTRAAGALKALLLLLVALTLGFRVLGGTDSFERLEYLYDRFLALIAVALVVIFQPELRRGLIRLGEARLLSPRARADEATIEPIVAASAYLAKQRMGALIVLEQEVGLRGLLEGGTDLNARLSTALLQSIFFPGSALHDLAVVVRGDTVRAAGVQLPLADPTDMPDPTLGSRHRAAVGLTKECDAIVVVVSEETGAIRIAERGRLSRPFKGEELAEQLRARLGVEPPTAARRRGRRAEPETEAVDLSGTAPEDALEPTLDARSGGSKSPGRTKKGASP